MLGRLFFPEEYEPEIIKVYCNGNPRMPFDRFPSRLHTTAPVDIIEDKNAIVMRLRHTLFEILQGRGLRVVTINENHVQLLHSAQNVR